MEMYSNSLPTLSESVNKYKIPGTWTRLRYTYLYLFVCANFVLGAIATISWALALGTNEIVGAAPSEKFSHTDTIRYVSPSLFHVPNIFSLFILWPIAFTMIIQLHVHKCLTFISLTHSENSC